MSSSPLIVALGSMADGQEADLFVLMSSKEELKTRDGKSYLRVGFRDATREVQFPIWGDSAWAAECRESWTPGEFYKLRAIYSETQYGPQLEIRKIRPVGEQDQADGFEPAMCQPRSRFDPVEMLDELFGIVQGSIKDPGLGKLVTDVLSQHREVLLTLPAASKNHHAFAGGFLEHVLCVTRNCLFLAERYAAHYPDMQPPLNQELVVAGGILHDIGKVRELEQRPEGAAYTAEGLLIGHILSGRDIVREAAADCDIEADLLLRLEHIIVSHQRLPEWGSPKPPMTPEALLVHYADDLDAKYQMMVEAISDDSETGPFTSSRNPLRQKLYRGPLPS